MGNKKSMGNNAQRARVYTWIVYPDSAPDAWRDLLDDHHILWCVSPLHDRDVNPDGTPKKPHWHVMMVFDSLKTMDQASEIAAVTNGTVCQTVPSPRGLVRYMAHLDNPEKYQYDKRGIESHGGLEIDDYLRSASGKYAAIREMVQFCVDNGIVEYADLFLYAMNNNPDWFESLCDTSTYAMSAFLKSRRHGGGV